MLSVITLFNLTQKEVERVRRLHSYLDALDAKIVFQCQMCKKAQSEATESKFSLLDKRVVLNSAEEDQDDTMRPSLLDNMEISMVLLSEFRTDVNQLNLLY